MKKRENRGLVLLAGVLHFMCMGLMYSWSKFSTAIRADLGYNHAQITFAYSLCMAMFTTGILMDGVIGRRMKPRACALLGMSFTVCGYLLSSFVQPGHGGWLYLTYGLLVGFGIGMMYNEWLNNILHWFPDRSGIASGLLLLGMGLTGITTTPLMARLSQLLGWRYSFRTIALLMLLMGLLGSRFLRPAPADLPRGKPPKAKAAAEYSAELTTGQMLRQPCFWSFALWKIVLIGLGQACSGQLAEIVRDLQGPEQVQLAAVSLFVLCNGMARLLWGFCCDKIGRLWTMHIIAGLSALGTALLAVSFWQQALIPVLAGLLLIALSYGGAATLGANYIASVFGKTHYRQNNGVSAMTCLPVNLGATAAIGLVRTQTGSYLPFFIAAIPATLLGVALSVTSQRLMKKKAAVNQKN